MGVVYSTLTRPIRTFNIANRAERIISREKPVRAPQYEFTEKQKKLTDEVNPDFLEKHYQKNMQLDNRLKDVFVTSTDSQINLETTTAEKSLPQSRRNRDEFNMDYHESTVIPEGKCTLKQALTFISQHREDPIKYNSENIAVQYKIDKGKIDEILKHFKSYVSFVPDAPLEKPEQDLIQKTIDDMVIKRQEMEKLEEENERREKYQKK
ncbi:PREDICTED: protein NDUFAF4 homolog [Dinoponera quadriceps]|uniref:Protein NDUFAF4 homolog n=1 Tax=Dinoponera quadriceps TaxID=609295 RepID=A0A6P3XT46_DINQU|nr:PREDICTED: protein NDUFAF4 homolog [Dinoponera quadriceps]